MNPLAPMDSADRIKLLQFVTLFLIGGTERHLSNLVQGLDPAVFELHLACLKRVGAFLEEIETRGIPVHEFNINSLHNLKTLREQVRFGAFLRRNGTQIVHSYGFYSNVFAVPAARMAGTGAVVASIRDSGDIWTRTQRRVQKMACRLADRVVVNAEAVKQRLIAEGYDPERLVVIRNGVDVAKFAVRNENGPRLRQELGIPPQAPVVSLFSRLNQLKGIEFFLEAAQMLAAEFDDVRFLIVGDSTAGNPAYRKKLEADVERMGLAHKVIFAGFRMDVPELLAESAMSVLPSLSEGLSNVLLEAMAASVPVVATRVGGNPEVVQDGATGFLVPPGDSAALARSIALLLRDPDLRLRFGAAGQRRVTEWFSLERMVRETERFYGSLLQSRQRRAPQGAGRASVLSPE